MYAIFPHFLTMTQSNYVISDTPEVLNRKHNVTLTEGQISTILYIMEGYIEGNDDYNEDSVFYQDVNSIFDNLEGVIDTFYEQQKITLASERQEIKEDLVSRINNPLNVTYPDVLYRELTPFEEEIEIQKYIRDNDD